MEDYKHLSEKAKAKLSLTQDERVESIKRVRWFGYSRAEAILEKLEDLLKYPKRDRMPSLLIFGSQNNGKTKIARRFESKHPSFDNPRGAGVSVPVLYIRAPTKPDENLFYNDILTKLSAPFKSSAKPAQKYGQVIGIFKRVDLRVLIIDEIQDPIAGPEDKKREFLKLIKNISNEVQIPIVGVGIKTAVSAIHTDPHLASRFEMAPLPTWKMDEEFLKLLKSFEKVIPLKKPSRLTETSMATKLHSMSEGLIGELSNLLDKAAEYAIKKNIEQITKHALDSVGWVYPSERRKTAERVV